MNSLKHYCIHSVVWDICSRPLYKGKLTKNYINKCLEEGLPLDYAHFYVKAANGSAAAHYYEKLLGHKLSRWTIHEMKGTFDVISLSLLLFVVNSIFQIFLNYCQKKTSREPESAQTLDKYFFM